MIFIRGSILSNQKKMEKEDIIITYIRERDIENVKRILKSDPNKVNDFSCGINTLMYAVSDYTQISEEMIKLLIMNGVNINAKNTMGLTSLHYAMGIHLNYNIIKILLFHGADINVVTNLGKSIKDYSIIWRNYEAWFILHNHIKDLQTIRNITDIIINNKKPNKFVDILEMIPFYVEKFLLYDDEKCPSINLSLEYQKRRK